MYCWIGGWMEIKPIINYYVATLVNKLIQFLFFVTKDAIKTGLSKEQILSFATHSISTEESTDSLCTLVHRVPGEFRERAVERIWLQLQISWHIQWFCTHQSAASVANIYIYIYIYMIYTYIYIETTLS